jgi:hypothetical protein
LHSAADAAVFAGEAHVLGQLDFYWVQGILKLVKIAYLGCVLGFSFSCGFCGSSFLCESLGHVGL